MAAVVKVEQYDRWDASGRRFHKWAISVACGCFLLLATGCRPSVERFEPNRLYAAVLEQETHTETDRAAVDVQQIVEHIFGTPDAPKWSDTFPAVLSNEATEGMPLGQQAEQLARAVEIQRAAVAVSSDEEGVHFGLYRKHCVQCHGIDGDGRGPAALLQAPYPRDFRSGMFKFKSTERSSKPLRSDLRTTLERGIPGTSMPAFSLLVEEDLEALVDYVIYLSVRGEVERRLLRIAVDELDYDSDKKVDQWLAAETLFANEASDEQAAELKDAVVEQLGWIRSVTSDVIGKWDQAGEKVVPVPSPPDELAEGKKLTAELKAEAESLFVGQVANCASCHGMKGDGITSLPADYDEWTKEWTTRLGLDPQDHDRLSVFFEAGAFMPKPLPARDLTLGSFHGGRSPEEIYRRLVAGIDGTPMPAASKVAEPSPTGLTERQLWLLVRYVQTLGPEKMGPEEMGPEEIGPSQAVEPQEGKTL